MSYASTSKSHDSASGTHLSHFVRKKVSLGTTSLPDAVSEAEQQNEYGFGYPKYVKREFEEYLTCGQHCVGFSRLVCKSCDFERILAFSCKGRTVCPSCVSRKMADSAAFLVDEVLPEVPYRQWTLSCPKHIRFKLMIDATAVVSEV